MSNPSPRGHMSSGTWREPTRPWRSRYFDCSRYEGRVALAQALLVPLHACDATSLSASTVALSHFVPIERALIVKDVAG